MTSKEHHAAKSHTERVNILILEDDRSLLQLLTTELTGNGYDVLAATGELDLHHYLKSAEFDLVVLDLALDGRPYMGLELIQVLRNIRNVPIIVISGHTQPWDRLRALEMGIDDYITKPFLVGEIMIRLKRVLKTYSSKTAESDVDTAIYAFAGFGLDPVRRIIQSADGNTIEVTETEFNLLLLLVRAAGRIVSRDELWKAVRGQSWSPGERALDGHIARLRAKLEPDADRPQIIRSARGIGYVLALPVSRVPSQSG